MMRNILVIGQTREIRKRIINESRGEKKEEKERKTRMEEEEGRRKMYDTFNEWENDYIQIIYF